MTQSARPKEAPAPPSSLDEAEAHLLNALLNAKRSTLRGTMERADFDTMRPHFDAVFAHLALIRCAIDPPHILALAARGPER